MIPWFKIGGIAAVMLAVYLGWNHYESLLEDNKTLTSNNERLAVQVESQKRAAEQLAYASHMLNEKYAAARNESQKQQEVIKSHDLEKIAKAKPDLLIRRINSGTVRMFRSIEDAANTRTESLPESATGGPAKAD